LIATKLTDPSFLALTSGTETCTQPNPADKELKKLEMWANAQRDGRPAEHNGALCSTPQSLADAH